MTHKHKFVPVEVLWLKLWGVMQGDVLYKTPKPPKVGWVVLACECGAVKTVRARLTTGKTILAQYQKLNK